MPTFARRFFLPFLMLVFTLTACSFPVPLFSTPTSTPTPSPTATSTPTHIPTPTNTSTPVPTPSPVPPPTLTPTPLLLAQAGTPLPASLPAMSRANAPSVSGLALWNEPAVTDLAWSPDGSQLAVAAFNSISIFSARDRKLVQSVIPSGGVVSLAYSPNGSLLAAGNQLGSAGESRAGNVGFWLVSTWAPLRIFYSYKQAVTSVDFSPDGRLFAIAYTSPEIDSSQDSVDFYNTLSWEITQTIQTGTNLEIAFSPDARLLATTPDRYSLKVWQTRTGALLRTIRTSFTGAVSCLAFSPDGRTLATGHYDGSLRLWEVATGKQLFTAETGGTVASLAYSPNGALLASGDGYRDFAVRLWDPTSLQQLRLLEGHTHAVDSLAFSPDGQVLASASYDGSVRLWGVRP